MSGNVRLQQVQAALTEQGVYDVKFCFRPGSVSKMPSSKVVESVGVFLNAYLNGEYTKVELISAPQIA